MSRPDCSPNFPISFSIKLISFNKNRATWFRSAQYYNIRWDSLFGMNLQQIAYFYFLRWQHFDLIAFNWSRSPIVVPVLEWVWLFVTSVSLEIIISLLPQGEHHDHDQRRKIREQKTYIKIHLPTLRMGMSCERLIASWKKLKNNLNWLNSTIGRKLSTLYFWLFTALDILFLGSVYPSNLTNLSTFISCPRQHTHRQQHSNFDFREFKGKLYSVSPPPECAS